MTALVPTGVRPSLTHIQGSALVLLSGVIFSFGGLAFRATADISAWSYVAFRGLGAAAIAIVALVLHHRSQLGQVVRDVEPIHLLAGFLLGTMSFLFIVAIEVTSVAFVLFLQTGAPISAAYFSWLLMRERVSRPVVLATLGTMVGMAIMVSGTLTASVPPAGLVAVLIPMIFGLYATIIRSARKIDPTVPVVISGLTMLVVGLGVGAATGQLVATRSDALIGVFAGAMLLGMPLFVFNRAQRVVPSSESALLLMSEVVLAPLWVWMFVGEQPERTTLVGGFVILTAVGWLTVKRVGQPTNMPPAGNTI